MTRKLTISSLLSCFIVACSFSLYADDTPGTASNLSLNGNANDSLGLPVNNPDNQDWFRITTNTSGNLSINCIFDPGLTGTVALYDANVSLISNSPSGSGQLSTGFQCSVPGQYYVKVNRDAGDGNYALSNSFSAPGGQNDIEPNNILVEAIDIAAGTSKSGQLGYGSPVDAADWYRITTLIDGGLVVTATFTGNLIGGVEFYDRNGLLREQSGINNGNTFVDFECLQPDVFYAKVIHEQNCGSYDLFYQFNPAPGLNDIEPNSTPADALPIAENEQKFGHLGYGIIGLNLDSADWYQFVTPEDGNISVSANFGVDFAGSVGIYDLDGTLLSNLVTGTGALTTSVNCMEGDTFNIKAGRANNCGAYNLEYDFVALGTPNDSEPNDSLNQSQLLASGMLQEGHLGYWNRERGNDEEEWYYLVNPGFGEFEVTVDFGSDLVASVFLYNDEGQLLDFESAGSGVKNVGFDCAFPDTFSVQIRRTSGCGAYEISYTSAATTGQLDAEPNNVQAESLVLFENVPKNGVLGFTDTQTGQLDAVDWYGLLGSADGDVSVSLTFNSGVTGSMSLHDINGAALGQTTTSSGTLSLSETCLGTDTFFVKVSRATGCGGYTLTYDWVEATTTGDIEPNNTFSQALAMPSGQLLGGHLGFADEGQSDLEDWYLYVHPGDGDFTLDVTLGPGLLGLISIYADPNSSALQSTAGQSTMSLTVECMPGDSIYVKISSFQGTGCNWYSAQMTTTVPPNPNDFEPNNFSFQAIPLFENVPESGHLGYGNDQQDWYNIRIAQIGSFSLPVTFQPGLSGAATLFNEQGQTIAFSNSGSNQVINATIVDTGLYRVEVRKTNGCGSYYFYEEPADCDAVNNPNTTNIRERSARLNWSPVAGADHYEIRGQQLGNPNVVTLNIPGGTGTFQVGGLAPNTSFYWQIRTHCDAAETQSGDWSEIDTFTTKCRQPSNLQVINLTATSARLTWTGTNSATGYQLKGRPVGAGSFTTIDLSGAGSTSLNTGNILNPSTSYEWKVDAICNTGQTSGFSALATFTTPASKKSASEIGQAEIRVVPNPSNGLFHVQVFGGTEKLDCEVFDLVGKRVFSGKMRSEESATIDLSDQKSGVYFLKINSVNGQQTERLIIE